MSDCLPGSRIDIRTKNAAELLIKPIKPKLFLKLLFSSIMSHVFWEAFARSCYEAWARWGCNLEADEHAAVMHLIYLPSTGKGATYTFALLVVGPPEVALS